MLNRYNSFIILCLIIIITTKIAFSFYPYEESGEIITQWGCFFAEESLINLVPNYAIVTPKKHLLRNIRKKLKLREKLRKTYNDENDDDYDNTSPKKHRNNSTNNNIYSKFFKSNVDLKESLQEKDTLDFGFNLIDDAENSRFYSYNNLHVLNTNFKNFTLAHLIKESSAKAGENVSYYYNQLYKGNYKRYFFDSNAKYVISASKIYAVESSKVGNNSCNKYHKTRSAEGEKIIPELLFEKLESKIPESLELSDQYSCRFLETSLSLSNILNDNTKSFDEPNVDYNNDSKLISNINAANTHDKINSNFNNINNNDNTNSNYMIDQAKMGSKKKNLNEKNNSPELDNKPNYGQNQGSIGVINSAVYEMKYDEKTKQHIIQITEGSRKIKESNKKTEQDLNLKDNIIKNNNILDFPSSGMNHLQIDNDVLSEKYNLLFKDPISTESLCLRDEDIQFDSNVVVTGYEDNFNNNINNNNINNLSTKTDLINSRQINLSEKILQKNYIQDHINNTNTVNYYLDNKNYLVNEDAAEKYSMPFKPAEAKFPERLSNLPSSEGSYNNTSNKIKKQNKNGVSAKVTPEKKTLHRKMSHQAQQVCKAEEGNLPMGEIYISKEINRPTQRKSLERNNSTKNLFSDFKNEEEKINFISKHSRRISKDLEIDTVEDVTSTPIKKKKNNDACKFQKDNLTINTNKINKESENKHHNIHYTRKSFKKNIEKNFIEQRHKNYQNNNLQGNNLNAKNKKNADLNRNISCSPNKLNINNATKLIESEVKEKYKQYYESKHMKEKKEKNLNLIFPNKEKDKRKIKDKSKKKFTLESPFKIASDFESNEKKANNNMINRLNRVQSVQDLHTEKMQIEKIQYNPKDKKEKSVSYSKTVHKNNRLRSSISNTNLINNNHNNKKPALGLITQSKENVNSNKIKKSPFENNSSISNIIINNNNNNFHNFNTKEGAYARNYKNMITKNNSYRGNILLLTFLCISKIL